MEDVTVIEKGVSTICKVAHEFTNDRIIVDFGGIYILADRIGDTAFELSGIPATSTEKPILNALVSTVETTTTVTKDDD